jgi:preprotein translocase subunit SecY
MAGFVETIGSISKIPELRRRILFTLGIFVVYRIGGHVPVPGIDGAALGAFFQQQRGTLLGMYDMFVGGSLSNAAIFALGIMPYISASIILQLLAPVVPYLEKLQKEGEEGRRKITQYTRYGTVLLAAIQAYGISIYLEGLTAGGMPVVPIPGWGFRMLTVLTLTSGTVFIMWLGEQITERGIGNGMSLIIFIGIVARYPTQFLDTIRSIRLGELSPIWLLILIGLMVAITGFVVMMTQGQRRIRVQHAKRVVGRKVYGGGSTHIPLRVNTAGVIPIIFAQAIIMFPTTLATFFQGNEFMNAMVNILNPGGVLHTVLYVGIIVFFTYFYTAIVLNPADFADTLRKQGGFIPGIRPGKRTADYIDRIMTRITLPSGLFLAAVAVLPYFFMQRLGAPFWFGGTGLLIVVGVGLDTMQQIESHLLMRHYDGLMKKGRIRARR